MGATNSGAVDGAVKNIQSKSSSLSGSVGFKGANAPDDVWKVSSALTNNGLMDAPQRHADNTLFTGITKAQENMDSGLKRDGLVNPGGPTESIYTRYVGQGFMKAPDAGDKGGADTGTGLKPLGTAGDILKREREREQAETKRARIQRQAERRREREQEEAVKRARTTQHATGLNNDISASPAAKQEAARNVAQGRVNLAGKAVSAQSRPALSDEAYASNRRTADALGKYKGVGDLPRFTTDAINSHGEKAVHEVADLIGQVHKRSPDQAKALLEKTMQGLAPAHRQSLVDTVRNITTSDTRGDQGGSEKNKLVSAMMQGIERARLNQDTGKGIQVAESGQIVSDTPTYALLANDGTKPTEPSEPEEPDDQDGAKKKECERLRLQIEVDQANVKIAEEQYEAFNAQVEQADEALNAKIEASYTEYGKAALELLGSGGFSLKRLFKDKRPEPQDLAGPLGPLMDVADINAELDRLQQEFETAKNSRALSLQELHDAKARVVATYRHWKSLGCK